MMDSNQLRKAFSKYFMSKGHIYVPSASLIPHDPSLLFTIAGMVPFKPYFLGQERAPFPRATSIQKCMRAGGKQNDLDQIGLTLRHLTFFEMLGNFSFGDYFKEDAIPFAWEFVTSILGLEPDRLWITVHTSDDDAEQIWIDKTGVRPERIQRLNEDNWWQMGETGPCGPCSEIYYDKGESYGSEGGPARGSEERYLEIWNLVFMQFDRQEDGSLSPLPKPCIDTGAGLERILPLLQGTGSVYDTDVLAPVLQAASRLTRTRYGEDSRGDVALRIISDHARSMTFLVGDGVFPSNEGRGYVLRRIIRRAMLRSLQLGGEKDVTSVLVDAVIATMEEQYPELVAQADFIKLLLQKEEDRFRRTLSSGASLLDVELEKGHLSGETAFTLHDTFGFPVELTKEIAAERSIEVDMASFEVHMASQRERARNAGLGGESSEAFHDDYVELLDNFGPSEFIGYENICCEGRIIGIVPTGGGDGTESYIFLDRTPFYPEGGGQIGDRGTLETDTATLEITDTSYALPGLIRHRVRNRSGVVLVGQTCRLQVDSGRRDAIRRNHSGTHLLHWALREVLGSHVKQQGSLVADDRLRFDFTHWESLTEEEIRRVEDLVNSEVIANYKVTIRQMDKEEALAHGAIAFFGEKYGEKVRVVHAGEHSLELCGGIHVDSLGMIGLVKVVSESSIGSNTRRIEAITGRGAMEYVWELEEIVEGASNSLKATRPEILGRIDAIRVHERELSERVKSLRSSMMQTEASALADGTKSGIIILRRDGWSAEELRELALALRSRPGMRVVVVGGSPDGQRASLVAAVVPEVGVQASELLEEAVKLLGGGVGRQAELAMAGGRNGEKLEDAIEMVRTVLRARLGADL